MRAIHAIVCMYHGLLGLLGRRRFAFSHESPQNAQALRELIEEHSSLLGVQIVMVEEMSVCWLSR